MKGMILHLYIKLSIATEGLHHPQTSKPQYSKVFVQKIKYKTSVKKNRRNCKRVNEDLKAMDKTYFFLN